MRLTSDFRFKCSATEDALSPYFMRFILINIPLLALGLLQLWCLGLPLAVEVVLLFVMLFITCAVSRSSLILLFASITIASTAVYLLFSSDVVKPREFYREHEKYDVGAHYKPLVTETFSIPFGDLLVTDPSAPLSLAEPRTTHFQTDDLGYRNRTSFGTQRFVINGDSFIVGNGITQEDTIPELLSASGIPSYSIAFPSDPNQYDERARTFLKAHPGNYQFALFYYEGSDFKSSGASDVKKEPTLPERYYKVSDTYDAFKVTFIKKYAPTLIYPKLLLEMRQRVERRFVRSIANYVRLFVLNGEQIAGHETHNKIARASKVDLLPVQFDPLVLARTKCVFFIPTKLRVYSPLLPQNQESTVVEPAPGFVALQERYAGTNVIVVDLTPRMRSVAFTLVEKGKYLFWRDDSHWNGNGTHAVLEAVKSCLSGDSADGS